MNTVANWMALTNAGLFGLTIFRVYIRLGAVFVIDPRVILSLGMIGVYIVPYFFMPWATFESFGVEAGVPLLMLAVFFIALPLALFGHKRAHTSLITKSSTYGSKVTLSGTVIALSIALTAYLIWVTAAGGFGQLLRIKHGYVGEVTSGIIAQLAQWVFLGIFPVLILIKRGAIDRYFAILFLCLILVLSSIEILIFGNRGTAIRLFVGIIAFLVFVNEKNVFKSLVVLAVFLPVLYVLPHIRDILVLGSGSNLTDILDRLNASLLLGSSADIGNELIIASAVATLTGAGIFAEEYGLRYLGAIFLMIPTEIYESFFGIKPSYQEFSTNVNLAISEQLGWTTGGGSAVTMIGDVFSSFGYFSWIVFPTISAVVISQKLSRLRINEKVLLKKVIFNTSLIYFITQDFKQFIWYLILGFVFVRIVTKFPRVIIGTSVAKNTYHIS